MSETKHTPAPWQVSWGHDVTGYPVFSIHGFSGPDKRDRPALDANARLIAAAPDLLEALIELVSMINALPEDRETYCAEILDAEAAIKRATEA